MKLKYHLNIAITLLMVCSTASAEKITTGEFVLDFDDAALLSLPTQIINTSWFDETNSADKTGTQLRSSENPGCFIPEAYAFNVFSETINTPPKGLEERVPQASTFDYTGDPSTGTGIIGLAGIHMIGGAFAGSLSFGDYHLSYDETRVNNGANGSGWVLTNNVSFPAPTFDLTNVTTTIIDDTNFSLSGDVVLTATIASMLLGEEGYDVGNFTFTTQPSTGDIARYSAKSKQLMIPTIKVDDKFYNVALTRVESETGQISLDLSCAKITNSTSKTMSEYDTTSGVVTIPTVEIRDTKGSLGEISSVQLKLVEGSNPLKFTVMKIGE